MSSQESFYCSQWTLEAVLVSQLQNQSPGTSRTATDYIKQGSRIKFNVPVVQKGFQNYKVYFLKQKFKYRSSEMFKEVQNYLLLF